MQLLEFVRLVLTGRVDTRDTPTSVPDAPEPVYDSHGNLVTGWHLSVRYVPEADALVLYWQHEPNPYTAGKSDTTTWTPDQVESLLVEVNIRLRTLAARRLF